MNKKLEEAFRIRKALVYRNQYFETRIKSDLREKQYSQILYDEGVERL